MYGSRAIQKIRSKKGKRKQEKRARSKGEFILNKSLKNRMERRSVLGREEEDRVFSILVRARETGRYDFVSKTTPNSLEDCAGKDFVVTRMVHGEIVERAFGITISRESQKESRLRHLTIPCFLVTRDMKDETLLQKVDALFV